MSAFIDSRLSALKAYVPGEQPEPGRYIKINTNEFPYPPAANVAEASAEAVLNMNLYSDLNCTKLKENFEKVFGFGKDNVIFTNGSDEALYLCFLTFCGRGNGAAFADITYGFYSVYADLCCVEKQIIPLEEDFSIDPEKYFALNKTIFIANPNAPTGLKLSLEQVSSILENNRDHIVVIDEAYADFSGESCSVLLNKYPNLIVVGTFSKSRGMAGARLGYIIASKEIVADVEKVKYSINPYNVNSITQAVGAAVLEANDYYRDRVSEICRTRDDFSCMLRDLGFEVLPSATNFVFAKHKKLSGKVIADELRFRNILVRHFDNDRVKEFVRITIGTPDQMRNVVSALEEIIGGK